MNKAQLVNKLFLLSCLGNLVLLSAVIYLYFFSTPVHLYLKDSTQEIICHHPEYCSAFQTLPFKELIKKLHDKKLIEPQYTVRDLALAYLVEYHGFDIDHALQNTPPSRSLSVDTRHKLPLYLHLSDHDFHVLEEYSRNPWPYTPKGMFLLLQQGNTDLSLKQAFCKSAPFLTIESWFSSVPTQIQRKTLLDLLLEHSWEQLSSCITQYAASPFSARRALLLQGVEQHSALAALLLLTTDMDYAKTELSPAIILELVHLAPVSQEGLEWARYIASHYPEDVAHYAETWLQHHRPSTSKEVRYHTVQPGESLWSIAQHYHIPLSTLMQNNHLEHDRIHPGKKLMVD